MTDIKIVTLGDKFVSKSMLQISGVPRGKVGKLAGRARDDRGGTMIVNIHKPHVHEPQRASEETLSHVISGDCGCGLKVRYRLPPSRL